MITLIHTKLEKPQCASEFSPRPRLTQQLTAATDKRLIVISAPAGYGKTTLLADWLHTTGSSWAWLSLDQTDSDLPAFMAYFIAAIQSADPGSCKNTQAILKGPQLPPLDQLATALINDLAKMSKDVFLVLDDYQLIKARIVHEFMTALVYRCPHHLHLVIATRADPPLPIPQWRARGYLAEIRAANLSFTHEEAHAFLTHKLGMALSEHAIVDLVALTEGWITGLKLAAISIRDRAARPDQGGHIEVAYADIRAASANQHVVDYLLDDVFSRQPRAIREFLMRTSVLDQFTAPLCNALVSHDAEDSSAPVKQASFVLKWIERANLFLIPLDNERRWFRYHHLFRELLIHRLKQKHDAAAIAQLHARASEWLSNEGLIEVALAHALAAGEPERAADLVEQHRHQLLNGDNWRALERWLNLLPEELVRRRPALLMARAWVLHFQSRTSAMEEAVQDAMARLRELNVNDAKAKALCGEAEAFWAQSALRENRFDEAVNYTQAALEHIPHIHAYARGIAAIALGLSSQAAGQSREGKRTLEQLFYQDTDRGSPIALRALLTLAWMDCIAGDWDEVRVLADYALKLANQSGRGLLAGWAHFFLGLHFYQRNDLDPAIEHFDAAVQARYSLNRSCATSCLIGLSMSYWAQGKTQQSAEASDALAEFALEAQDAGMSFEAQAFRARLSLLQSDIAPTLHWAQTADSRNDFSVWIWPLAPLIIRLQAFVSDGTPASLHTATSLLQPSLAFVRSTHNVWREVELLAIQALALHKQNQTEASLDTLEEALVMAKPGHFVRTFLDLGRDLTQLLEKLAHQGRQADYACELLTHFGSPVSKLDHRKPEPEGQYVDPLTNREMDILKLMDQRLSNEEIAQALFISRLTVKSHSRNLFDKLGVTRRRFAVQRARELGLLPAA